MKEGHGTALFTHLLRWCATHRVVNVVLCADDALNSHRPAAFFHKQGLKILDGLPLEARRPKNGLAPEVPVVQREIEEFWLANPDGRTHQYHHTHVVPMAWELGDDGNFARLLADEVTIKKARLLLCQLALPTINLYQRLEHCTKLYRRQVGGHNPAPGGGRAVRQANSRPLLRQARGRRQGPA